MNIGGWLLWGFGATMILSVVATLAHATGLTRMSLPFMLGSIFRPGRDTARLAGTFAHFFLGLVFALLYVAIFNALGEAGWWRGALLGFLHGATVLTLGMSLLPAFHRGMATEQHGPSTSRLLEPPGMFALHYGPATPLVVMVTHILYGAVLGLFYVPGG